MWFDYHPPKKLAIDEVSKRLDDTEIFLGNSHRTKKVLSRLKAASVISMCPETVDLIFDILDRFYAGTKFHQSQLDDLKEVRLDVYLAIEKYIKQGKISVYESKVGISPSDSLHSRKINVPRKRSRTSRTR